MSVVRGNAEAGPEMEVDEWKRLIEAYASAGAGGSSPWAAGFGIMRV